ncbi:carbohydrate-binding module family 13 protein, partial [Mycena leptocephala]
GSSSPPPPTGHTIHPGASSMTCLTAPTHANGGRQSWTQNGQTIVVYGSMWLDVTDGSTTNGVKMQIWLCTPGAGDAAQHFTVTTDNRIQWNTTECLDITGGSLTKVQMWACAAGNTNQLWNIV